MSSTLLAILRLESWKLLHTGSTIQNFSQRKRIWWCKRFVEPKNNRIKWATLFYSSYEIYYWNLPKCPIKRWTVKAVYLSVLCENLNSSVLLLRCFLCWLHLWFSFLTYLHVINLRTCSYVYHHSYSCRNKCLYLVGSYVVALMVHASRKFYWVMPMPSLGSHNHKIADFLTKIAIKRRFSDIWLN